MCLALVLNNFQQLRISQDIYTIAVKSFDEILKVGLKDLTPMNYLPVGGQCLLASLPSVVAIKANSWPQNI